MANLEVTVTGLGVLRKALKRIDWNEVVDKALKNAMTDNIPTHVHLERAIQNPDTVSYEFTGYDKDGNKTEKYVSIAPQQDPK